MNNTDIFKPDNLTISDIFSFTGIYTIPNYQRQYTWDDENLEELWTDLYESFTSGNDKCYFLGSIVVVDRKNGEHELVDGQQRITTLMIMLNVLYKNFPNINNESKDILNANHSWIDTLIFFNKSVNRLRLQQDPDYDSDFKVNVTKVASFEKVKKPTKEEMKKEDPKYKYINTSNFFYTKFSELKKEDDKNNTNILGEFVNYILFRTNIIKIICFDQSFALKLFLVLNDRGTDLSNSDIVKTVIYNEFDKDKEKYSQHDKDVFNSNWKEIEDICNDYDFSMDDFLVFFEYFKLKRNPKKHLSDELRELITNPNTEINSFVAEMKQFADNVKKIYTEKNSTIYSLRYIPWEFYVTTSIAAAYQVEYDEFDELLELLRKFFYLSWIGGKTLNGVKQTSFNIIQAIANNKSLEEIADIINNYILANKLVKNSYEALDGDVYGENFLKPLMLSIDYNVREELLTEFYNADKNIHMDHILPKKYYEKPTEWPYIVNKEETLPYLNKLGNMALLLGKKNEEALNFGFDRKIEIYLGEDNKKTGRTAFDTTNWIINDYDKVDESKSKWDIQHIKDRQTKLMSEIENMLDISRDDIVDEENYIPDVTISRGGYYKWEYKGKFYTNSSLVRQIISDYVNDNKFNSLDEFDYEIKNYHIIPILPLLSVDTIVNGYTYRKIKNIDFNLYTPSQFNSARLQSFLSVMKKYYDFESDLNSVDEII